MAFATSRTLAQRNRCAILNCVIANLGEYLKDMLHWHGLPFHDVFIAFAKQIVVVNSLHRIVFKQMLWVVIGIVEGRLTKAMPRSGPIIGMQIGRQLSMQFSDVSNGAIEVAKCLDSKNPRMVTRALGRHKAASVKIMSKEQFISLSGPDGTKIGQDLSINFGAIMRDG